MITASQLRAGMAIKYEGQNYKVLAADYHSGQGKMGGVTHARLRNLSTATFWEHSFRSGLKLEEIQVDRYSLEFLYADAEQCCFLNPESYEQIEIGKSLMGPQAGFLLPGMRVSVEFVEGRTVEVLFPEYVEVRVVDTYPPIHQQQDSPFKPAMLENGVKIMVPLFVKTGDVIRVDLQAMKYMDRVKTDR
ncbi:MAG: elongation factor P [Acidobacteria bacterium]|nr:elongation factor P [Acidobacteriota bacterium]